MELVTIIEYLQALLVVAVFVWILAISFKLGAKKAQARSH